MNARNMEADGMLIDIINKLKANSAQFDARLDRVVKGKGKTQGTEADSFIVPFRKVVEFADKYETELAPRMVHLAELVGVSAKEDGNFEALDILDKAIEFIQQQKEGI